MNRTTLGNLSVSLLVLVMLTGCAFISKFGLDKELAKADEAQQAASQAQAPRYANPQYTAAQNTYNAAKGMIDSKQYKEAKLKLAEAASRVVHDTLRPGDGGLIAVDGQGNITMPFNTPGMFRGAADDAGRFEVGIWE